MSVNISLADQKDIMRLIDYDSIPYLESVILVKVNGRWKKVDNCEIGFADLICKVTKNYTGPSFSVKAVAGVLRVKTGGRRKGSPFNQLNALYFGGSGCTEEYLCASAGASASPLHYEANAKATLVQGETDDGVVSYHVGAGVSTGAGIKDDSLTAKFEGCGIQVGRKLGVSVFDNEVSVDLGKLVKDPVSGVASIASVATKSVGGGAVDALGSLTGWW